MGTDDFHDPFHVVGEHIQAHLRAHPCQLSGQEVRRTHPLFERPEGMLNRPFSHSHHLRRFAQPKLHFLQYGFMLPASNSSFRARSALRLQRAALAFRTPVTMQLQAFFNVGVVPDQRLASWTNVFVFYRFSLGEKKALLSKTFLIFGARGRLEHCRVGRV